MTEIFLDTIIDGLKILPFLFIAFLIIEIVEHKLSDKNEKIVKNAGKYSPILGSVLGIIPQCGFSVLATNLYITRIISLGTLIAVYLSTSDEMLPILIAEGENISLILQILGIKLIIGIFFGLIIDFLFRNQPKNTDFHLCDDQHCDCKHSLIKSSIIHTLKTFIFIFIVTFILNTLFYIVGEDTLKSLFNNNNWYTPFLTSLIGLIPNCAASVTITELYLNEIISLGSVIAGLLTGSGIALLALFKLNKNLKENLFIVSLMYFIGVISGIIINCLSVIM